MTWFQYRGQIAWEHGIKIVYDIHGVERQFAPSWAQI